MKPEFHVGDWVAILPGEDLNPWAAWRFVGLTTYQGTQAAVLDLRRTMPAHVERGPILIGYNVVDLRNGLPLLVVLDAGSHIRTELEGCTG